MAEIYMKWFRGSEKNNNFYRSLVSNAVDSRPVSKYHSYRGETKNSISFCIDYLYRFKNEPVTIGIGRELHCTCYQRLKKNLNN